MKVTLIALTCAWLTFTCVLAEMDGSQRTILATALAPAKTDKPRQLYEDQDFRIVAVDFGCHESPQTPGIFILGKKNQKWIRVDKISLAGAVLGRNPSFEECKAVGKRPPSIGWDFSLLAKQDYVDMPLKNGGFLFFPDLIERDEDNGRVIFRSCSDWKMPMVETVLSFSLDDLRNVLELCGPAKLGTP